MASFTFDIVKFTISVATSLRLDMLQTIVDMSVLALDGFFSVFTIVWISNSFITT